MKDECQTCMYWTEDPRKPEHGRCRIGPPTVVACGRTVVTEWRTTRKNDWCGDHEVFKV